MKALITGGAGFLGHYLVQHLLDNTDWEIQIVDKLTYAARGLDRLRSIGAFDTPRVRIFTHDIASEMSEGLRGEIGHPHYIFHLAAESHVDNSVIQPLDFVWTNVLGTTELLRWASDNPHLKKFVYMSTDEVFGPTELDAFAPFDRHNPQNPYAASKSGGEQMCVAFEHTYKMPIHVVHCMNIFGKRQHPEKFIPKAIKLMLNNKPVQVYTDKDGDMGSRYYIHAEDVAHLLLVVAKEGYDLKENIAGILEVDNDAMAVFIADVLGKEPLFQKMAFDLGESSHDLRYDIEGTLATGTTEDQFWQQLRDVINWTASHPEWLEV